MAKVSLTFTKETDADAFAAWIEDTGFDLFADTFERASEVSAVLTRDDEDEQYGITLTGVD
jgi:hypothetical protein